MASKSTASPLLPVWLDQGFLEGILRNYYKNNEIEVINFDVKSASGNGEGFMSSMYRTKVNFTVSKQTEEHQQTTLHLIIKAAIAELEEALSNFDVYEKEVEFYDKIAPKINEKLKELNEPQLLPECYGVCKTKKIMVIEDLSAKGYSIVLANNGCTIFEAKAILKRAAVFNAIGVILKQEQADIFANFKSGHLTRDVDAFIDMYSGMYDALLDTISTWPESTDYYEKMKLFRKDIVETWHRALDVNQTHFNALVHNDLWPPNIMTKGACENEDAPFENIVLIDFQNALWGSPTLDLHLFLNMALCEPLTPDRFDELVEYYHSYLISCLQRLKYDGQVPNFTEFHSEYRERKIMGFIASCLDQAITIDNNGDVEYNDLIKNNEKSMKIKRQLYQKPKIQAILRKMLPYYKRIGTFDCLS